jgi:large subunit ribosomal protein L30
MARKLRIRQTGSTIGRSKDQKKVVEALGLRRLHQVVVHDDTPQVRGMVNKVAHLLEVEEVSE